MKKVEQEKDTEYTAKLDNWVYDHFHKVFWGNVIDDKRDRFINGTWIHTSHCLEHEAKEGDIVHTLNSSYLLGTPQKPSKSQVD